MKNNNSGTLKFSDIESGSDYIVKTFVASNNNKDPLDKHFLFDHPFSFDGIVFGICMKGKARAKIDFKEYNVEKDSIIIILPGHILELLEQSEDFFIELLTFSDEFVIDMPLPKDLQIVKKIALNPVINALENNINTLIDYHSFIIKTFETRKDSPFLAEMIKGLLYSLIMELATIYQDHSHIHSKKKNSRYEELTEHFFLLLFDHYKEERNVSFYADKICITPKHLSVILKETTGHPVNSWIDDTVIMGAKSLLKSTSFTVLQISEELNFPTASYFGRFFKRLTGMTPLEYRDS